MNFKQKSKSVIKKTWTEQLQEQGTQKLKKEDKYKGTVSFRVNKVTTNNFNALKKHELIKPYCRDKSTFPPPFDADTLLPTLESLNFFYATIRSSRSNSSKKKFKKKKCISVAISLSDLTIVDQGREKANVI